MTDEHERCPHGFIHGCGHCDDSEKPQPEVQPTTMTWEERFDKRFVTPHIGKKPGEIGWNGDTAYFDEDFVTPTSVKSFIRTLISNAKEEERKRLVEGLEFQTWKIPDGADIYEVRTRLRHWLENEHSSLSSNNPKP